MMPRQGAAAPWYPRPKYEKKREQNSHFSPFRRPHTHPSRSPRALALFSTKVTSFAMQTLKFGCLVDLEGDARMVPCPPKALAFSILSLAILVSLPPVLRADPNLPSGAIASFGRLPFQNGSRIQASEMS